jgi:hypothetical protein
LRRCLERICLHAPTFSWRTPFALPWVPLFGQKLIPTAACLERVLSAGNHGASSYVCRSWNDSDNGCLAFNLRAWMQLTRQLIQSLEWKTNAYRRPTRHSLVS